MRPDRKLREVVQRPSHHLLRWAGNDAFFQHEQGDKSRPTARSASSPCEVHTICGLHLLACWLAGWLAELTYCITSIGNVMFV